MTKEAMKLALEALQWFTAAEPWDEPDVSKAIKALEEALAKQEQSLELVEWCDVDGTGIPEPVYRLKAKQEQGEPVAWMEPDWADGTIFRDSEVNKTTDFFHDHMIPLYTTPPQRTWVGLTNEQMRQICGSVATMREAVREAEAILKEGNT
jgi:hypothetical protein